MSSRPREKPFWLRPPWQILFDLAKLYKVRPWDLNIARLLSTFLNEMRKTGYIDFAASGTALLSSSTILRLQSETIMKPEEPPETPEAKPMEPIPPALQLPFRYEFTSTTLDNLLAALEEILKIETVRKTIKVSPITPPVAEFFREYEQFTIQEDELEDFYVQLQQKLKGKATLPLSQLVKGKNRLETVRIFMILLFLASQGRIELIQEEEFGEIEIALNSELSEVDRILTT
ncbi:hypothetical protein [Candidatus Hecatella orcuttiae]|jgi:segregation and condensation protein A|uniref:hypothetical protein n=1 Tax=Candidatus Hecatella orcuttiae TaxID=1935119 RepID=UPI0028681991|nr:hypothetical protein [Candidatus Hecatella orcuttiae]